MTVSFSVQISVIQCFCISVKSGGYGTEANFKESETSSTKICFCRGESCIVLKCLMNNQCHNFHLSLLSNRNIDFKMLLLIIPSMTDQNI